MYYVIVGNVGIVFSGTSKREALLMYNVYLDHSTSHYGRCSGESVTLLQEDTIVQEHIGSIDSSQYYETI
jgi:hypothetical protein